MTAQYDASLAGPRPRPEPTMQQVLWRGFRGRCPACGEGKMFRAFLKVTDECPACGEELHHHRADDFPAYIVIVIVGHLVVPLVLASETHFSPSYLFHVLVWPALVLVLALGLLQPVKGAIVALQWSIGMHGFDEGKKQRVLAATPLAPIASGAGPT
jgi:uncharacterized protein (DUF983 family)